jgi:hypothetical protein
MAQNYQSVKSDFIVNVTPSIRSTFNAQAAGASTAEAELLDRCRIPHNRITLAWARRFLSSPAIRFERVNGYTPALDLDMVLPDESVLDDFNRYGTNAFGGDMTLGSLL